MFRKLRNKLILINLSITTVVIVIAFSIIYIVSTRSAANRPLFIQEFQNNLEQGVDTEQNNPTDEVREFVAMSLRTEKNTAARELLITLISSGLAIELAVIFISYLMADEAIKPVREAYESQKIFIANASHEIKTPLAAISANLEAADIKNNHWIKNVELETEKLTILNKELLTLAKTDLVTEPQIIEADLKKITKKISDSFKARAADKQFTVKLKSSKKIKIDVSDYEQILSILLDNAIKYSDKLINVELAEHSLTVENDGKMISSEQAAHVFDRFYQTDKSSDGVGLGLSIAKSLADKNHWKISVSSDSEKELTSFKLLF